ncbi:MAG: hypothetical protein DRJ01_12095 [Bacteroidetes bacterium]|nr:MAG: hypothetical protein DRJ01_12095 [Bacteroidota bacterium]
MKKITYLIILITFIFTFGIVNSQELKGKDKLIFKKAEKLTHQKKYLTAIHYYEEILKSNEHVETLMNIADIYFISLSQKNYNKALEFYQRAESAINSAINKNRKLEKRKKIKELKQTCTNNIKICLSHIEEFNETKKRHKAAKKRLDNDNLK